MHFLVFAEFSKKHFLNFFFRTFDVHKHWYYKDFLKIKNGNFFRFYIFHCRNTDLPSNATAAHRQCCVLFVAIHARAGATHSLVYGHIRRVTRSVCTHVRTATGGRYVSNVNDGKWWTGEWAGI
jgi:hypothetical protein